MENNVVEKKKNPIIGIICLVVTYLLFRYVYNYMNEFPTSYLFNNNIYKIFGGLFFNKEFFVKLVICLLFSIVFCIFLKKTFTQYIKENVGLKKYYNGCLILFWVIVIVKILFMFFKDYLFDLYFLLDIIVSFFSMYRYIVILLELLFLIDFVILVFKIGKNLKK